MRKNGQWGGHLELQALTQCFRCIIIVHKRNLEEYSMRPITVEPNSILHLAYFQHEDFEHYVSIRSIKDESQFPALAGLDDLNNNMYNFMLHDDPEEFLLRKQLEEMDIMDKMEEI